MYANVEGYILPVDPVNHLSGFTRALVLMFECTLPLPIHHFGISFSKHQLSVALIVLNCILRSTTKGDAFRKVTCNIVLIVLRLRIIFIVPFKDCSNNYILRRPFSFQTTPFLRHSLDVKIIGQRLKRSKGSRVRKLNIRNS